VSDGEHLLVVKMSDMGVVRCLLFVAQLAELFILENVTMYYHVRLPDTMPLLT